jgi:hypothetical protein
MVAKVLYTVPGRGLAEEKADITSVGLQISLDIFVFR